MGTPWPQYIWFALAGISIFVSAVKDGEPRKPWSFESSVAGAISAGALLYWGGFFDALRSAH